MNELARTEVRISAEMPWAPIGEHPHLFHREIFNAEDADRLGVRVSSVLWEQIGVGGAVLPHYHDEAEVIHITRGKVKVLINGEWRSYQAGDSFHVPAGTVHSVRNDDVAPTEQISIFLPVASGIPGNCFFHSHLVDFPLDTPLEQAR